MGTYHIVSVIFYANAVRPMETVMNRPSSNPNLAKVQEENGADLIMESVAPGFKLNALTPMVYPFIDRMWLRAHHSCIFCQVKSSS